MNLRRIATATAVLALAATATAAPATAQTTLRGTVGPGFTITLTKNGKKVKTLKPGRYRITVDDKATMHNFVLQGPGVNREITGLNFVGRRSATITLKKGTYRYVCTPHPTMKGSFTVK